MTRRRRIIARPASPSTKGGDDLRTQLLRQIRDLRAQIDPRLIDAARAALEGLDEAGFAPAATVAAPQGYVALDRRAIQRTVELFLADRDDDGRFASELSRRLTQDATVH